MPSKPAVIATLVALVGVAPTRHSPAPAPVSFRDNAARSDAFEGAWRQIQVQVTLRNGKVILIHPEASLFVATKTHYSRRNGFPPSHNLRFVVDQRYKAAAAPGRLKAGHHA